MLVNGMRLVNDLENKNERNLSFFEIYEVLDSA